ncbi:hypothetical protein [Thalassospira alkalitolerans]|uniref:hypothetical protein n=1 Tax=Thalassospira alkalitolerans TaxID=1293890 RepID=UPI0030EE3439
MKNIDIHPLEQSRGGFGVADFFFPVSEHKIDHFTSELAKDLTAYINCKGINASSSVEGLWLVLIYLVLDASNLYMHASVLENSASKNVDVRWGRKQTGFLNRLKQGEAADPVVLSSAQRMFGKRNVVRDYLRWLYSASKRDGLSRVPPEFVNREDILCFAADYSMASYAAGKGKRLILGRFEQWIEPHSSQGVGTKIEKQVIDDVTDIICLSFVKFSCSVSDYLRTVIFAMSEYAVSTGVNGLSSVMKKATKLPDEIWLGSCGAFPNRLLAYAASKEGKKASVYDHGSGSGWMNIPLIHLINIQFSHTYFMYTQAQVLGAKKILTSDLKVHGAVQTVFDVSPFRLFSKVPERKAGERKRTSKPIAMFVPSVYMHEKAIIPPLCPDITTIDFQLKLVTSLLSLGYEVVVKPHPECKIGVSHIISELRGVSISSEPFEKVMWSVDLLVFDYLATTALRSALYTDIPIVVMDHGRIPLLDEAAVKLQKRLYLVPVSRNTTNSSVFDRDVFSAAIEQSKCMRQNTEFVKSYFS